MLLVRPAIVPTASSMTATCGLINSLPSAAMNKFMSSSSGIKLKHQEQQSEKKWTKILPESMRKRMEAKKKPKVAVLNLHGMIAAPRGRGNFGGRQPLSLVTTEKLIDKAFSLKKLEAVFLSINSPGGSAVQSELIADYIAQKAKDKEVPVVSFVEDVAASGGYWLATAAPVIYASKSSIVGSIGVISQSFGFHEAINKVGIERRTQTAGEFKAFSDPFKPWEEKDKAIVRNILSALHENFKNQVKNARGDKLKDVAEDQLFSGQVWVGQQAVDLGLVDGLNTMHKFIKDEFDDKVDVVKVKSSGGMLSSLFGSAEAAVEFSSPMVTTALAQQVTEAFFSQHQDENLYRYSTFYKGIKT